MTGNSEAAISAAEHLRSAASRHPEPLNITSPPLLDGIQICGGAVSNALDVLKTGLSMLKEEFEYRKVVLETGFENLRGNPSGARASPLGAAAGKADEATMV
ncbi:hypothetical protein CSUB01_09806 [Colletotrichum sublineola]|uniref:Uncharacterized protein n=1 Tax=Colletotrichum sublineola TaxID=1173701 RepID=A0A066XGP0_COLSU|nr:hypothetical protein CSUB01_09806 [Colletotrichum sublineola]